MDRARGPAPAELRRSPPARFPPASAAGHDVPLPLFLLLFEQRGRARRALQQTRMEYAENHQIHASMTNFQSILRLFPNR